MNRRVLIPATLVALLIGVTVGDARALPKHRAVSSTVDDTEPGVPGENFRPAPADAAICVPPTGQNIQVNQDCAHTDPALSTISGRGQAKNSPSIAANPRDERNLVASYTDYRGGDSNCGSSYSLDGGRSWTDVTVPTSYVDGDFVGKPRQDYQAGAGTSVAWDSRGNTYLLCMLYNRGVAGVSPNPDMSGGLYVFRSTGSQGRSWNFFATPVAENKLQSGGPEKFAILDSPRIAIDTNPRSPHRDRIHVTWVFTDSDFTSHVFAAHSDDFGTSFSAPVQVAANSDLCPMTYGVPTDRGTCNLNDNPQAIVDRDGSVHVAWVNRNGAQSSETDNKNQILVATSRDGGTSFAAPVRAGDSYELPDCDTYQGKPGGYGGLDGYSCVPEKSTTTRSAFRQSNYVRGVVHPRTGELLLVYGSYVNRNSHGTACEPQFLSMETLRPLYSTVKTAGCNNDVLLSVSTDGGRTFSAGTIAATEATSLTSAGRQQSTDQWSPDIAVSPSGVVAVSYLDRGYGDATRTGDFDVSLTTFRLGSRTGAVDGSSLRTSRVTTRSMPVPSQLDVGRYLGDYNSLTFSGGHAVPIWADTRVPATAICPGTAKKGVPPRLCYFDANGVRANTQNIDVARVSVR